MHKELEKIAKHNPEIVDAALAYLAENPRAMHKDVVRAVYDTLGKHLQKKSYVVYRCVDVAFYRINADPLEGLPLFEVDNE